MTRLLKRVFCWALLLATAPLLVLAQNNACPQIVRTALDAAGRACQSTGRNQACYGNVDLTARLQPDAPGIAFNKVGDIVDVSDLQSLVLSPMDEVVGKWGVALLRLQANIPDTLPGQNVTFLLFGDVQIINGVTPDSTLRPMQAFYLRTGVGDSQCQEAPESGMLVQTPQGVGEVTFNVNGVDVQMGSTVFFQAEADKEMTVSTLEGAAYITAEDETQVIVPGTWASIPLGSPPQPQTESSEASGGNAVQAAPAPPVPLIPLPGVLITEIVHLLPGGPPDAPRSYTGSVDKLQALPLGLLERPVQIAPPLSDTEVEQINSVVQTGVLCGVDPLPACPTSHLPDGTECVLLPAPGQALPPGETRPLCSDAGG